MHVSALLIRGLRWGSATEGTLFTDGPLTASTLPAGVPGLSTSLNVVGRLAGPPGRSSVTADLRKPAVSVNPLAVRLKDDATGTAAIVLAPDPGLANTSRWTLDTVGALAPSTTSLVLTGPTAPAVDQFVYLPTRHGVEAIKVTAVVTSGNVHTCTVARGQLASHAKAAQVEPSQYTPGDEGGDDALIVWSRIPFGEGIVEACLYQFRMKPEDPHAVEACEWAWLGQIRERPKPSAADFSWSVTVTHITKAILEYAHPAVKATETRQCVRITQRNPVVELRGPGPNSGFDITAWLPAQVRIDLRAYEAERIFNTRLRAPRTPLSSSLVSTLNSRLTGTSAIRWELVGEVGGYTWVWTVIKVEAITVSGALAQQAAVRVHGALSAYEPGASINDSPVTYRNGPVNVGGTVTFRTDELNEGFVEDANPFIRTDLGEKPPKFYLRPRLKTNFPEALLYLLLSGYGGGVNDATYDKLIGGWGVGLDPAWLNTGTSGTPISDDEGTLEILKLAGILDETYDYAALPQTKIGAWLDPQLNLHTCLLGFVPSTGKIALRLWARDPASRTALNPVIDPDGEIEVGETLDPIRYLILKRGPDPVTLEFKPESIKPIELPDTRFSDTTASDRNLTVEIWKAGSAFTEQEIATGPLARFIRAQVLSGHGEPALYAIPVGISTGFQFGDLVSWTDSSIPTATGRGVTALPLIVLGVDRDFERGTLVVHCVQDVVNAEATASASAGRVAPRLKITGIWSVSGNVFTVVVESVSADASFRIDTSHGAIWASIVTGSARVRVVNKNRHNPSGISERVGLLEASGLATALHYDVSAKKSLLTLSFSAAWARGGYTLADVVEVGAFVLLSDHVPAQANPEGATIQPLPAQGYASGSGRDFTKINQIARRMGFDGRRSLIGS